MIPNNRVFQAIWIGPTNHRGDRVKIIDHRMRKTVTVSVSYHDMDSDAKDVAISFLKSKGIDVHSFGEADRGYFLMSNNFENQIK